MEAQGIPKATAMSLLSILGVGMNTYGPKTEYMTGTAQERAAQIKKDLENMTWDSAPPAYREFLTAEQMKQVDKRREETKRDVIASVTKAAPVLAKHESDKTYAQSLKNREIALSRFRAMAQVVPKEDAQQLLYDYYTKPKSEGGLGYTSLKKFQKSYNARLQILDSLYAK